MAKRIEQKLREKLRIEHFVSPCCDGLQAPILTGSGYCGYLGNCGSSYAVTIVSPDFAKKMTLARHKLGKPDF